MQDGPSPPRWRRQADPETTLRYALPHTVVPQLLRPVLAASLPAHALRIATMHDAVNAIGVLRDLGNQNASFYDNIGALRNLRQISVTSRHVNADMLTKLKDLPFLTSVELLRCPRINGSALKVIASLPHLEALSLQWCDGFRPGDLAALSQSTTSSSSPSSSVQGGHGDEPQRVLPHLRHLDLSGFGGVLSPASMTHIRALTSLTGLCLNDCMGVTHDSIAALAPLTNLRHLEVSGCNLRGSRFTPIPLDLIVQQWPLLQSLSASRYSMPECFTAKTENDLTSLRHLPQLTSLNLNSTRDVTSALLRTIAPSLQQLRVLKLSGCEGLTNDDENASLFVALSKLPLEELTIQSSDVVTTEAVEALLLGNDFQFEEKRLRGKREGSLSADSAATQPTHFQNNTLEVEPRSMCAPRLTALDVALCQNFGDEAFALVLRFPKLRQLGVYRSAVKMPTLAATSRSGRPDGRKAPEIFSHQQQL